VAVASFAGVLRQATGKGVERGQILKLTVKGVIKGEDHATARGIALHLQQHDWRMNAKLRQGSPPLLKRGGRCGGDWRRSYSGSSNSGGRLRGRNQGC
jgi:hypothetical protein